jgi:hypothetical protein
LRTRCRARSGSEASLPSRYGRPGARSGLGIWVLLAAVCQVGGVSGRRLRRRSPSGSRFSVEQMRSCGGRRLGRRSTVVRRTPCWNRPTRSQVAVAPRQADRRAEPAATTAGDGRRMGRASPWLPVAFAGRPRPLQGLNDSHGAPRPVPPRGRSAAAHAARRRSGGSLRGGVCLLLPVPELVALRAPAPGGSRRIVNAGAVSSGDRVAAQTGAALNRRPRGGRPRSGQRPGSDPGRGEAVGPCCQRLLSSGAPVPEERGVAGGEVAGSGSTTPSRYDRPPRSRCRGGMGFHGRCVFHLNRVPHQRQRPATELTPAR